MKNPTTQAAETAAKYEDATTQLINIACTAKFLREVLADNACAEEMKLSIDGCRGLGNILEHISREAFDLADDVAFSSPNAGKQGVSHE